MRAPYRRNLGVDAIVRVPLIRLALIEDRDVRVRVSWWYPTTTLDAIIDMCMANWHEFFKPGNCSEPIGFGFSLKNPRLGIDLCRYTTRITVTIRWDLGEKRGRLGTCSVFRSHQTPSTRYAQARDAMMMPAGSLRAPARRGPRNPRWRGHEIARVQWGRIRRSAS